MRLFVTEKPDVARELAGYIGRKNGRTPKREAKFIEVGPDVVIWARGHLLEHAQVDEYFPEIPRTDKNSKSGRLFWSAVPLPILPGKFMYRPPKSDADRAAQLREIGKFMKQADQIFNAADRDREGQLIFDEIVEHFGIKRAGIKRLYFSSLDDAAFDRAFNEVMDNNSPAVANSGLAAKARGQADWLIGMNGTRAMTLAHGKDGLCSVGRVMTPTMSVIVRRHMDIKNFKEAAFYTPVVELPDGTVIEWKKRLGDDRTGLNQDGKIIDRATANRITDSINNGMQGVTTEAHSIEKMEEPPLPFSLPSIQSELSKKHGLTVDEVTKACQSLYNKKMQTYVGTDCPYLPEAMHSEASAVFEGLRPMFGKLYSLADFGRKYGCWNDKKLTGEGAAAHHGIIPTGKAGELENEAERLVYEAVCKRFIAQFYPEHRYLSISLKAVFGQEEFGANARKTIALGWREIEGGEED